MLNLVFFSGVFLYKTLKVMQGVVFNERRYAELFCLLQGSLLLSHVT